MVRRPVARIPDGRMIKHPDDRKDDRKDDGRTASRTDGQMTGCQVAGQPDRRSVAGGTRPRTDQPEKNGKPCLDRSTPA
ncbi:hypothetical protein GCM10009828_061790 [Actinoplanes couchii]|uniref:Uncharacterized protein n=1 Tax=Actinoplanes couchii TaxID=403638 RepID=A0ABQ3XQE9_9ACTN|nr:hypothetical protein Aco03nite_091300 [Actinoplanes couchii]